VTSLVAMLVVVRVALMERVVAFFVAWREVSMTEDDLRGVSLDLAVVVDWEFAVAKEDSLMSFGFC